MKKLVSLFVALCMVFTMIPALAETVPEEAPIEEQTTPTRKSPKSSKAMAAPSTAMQRMGREPLFEVQRTVPSV